MTTEGLDLKQPFTRARARAAGITDAQLRGRDYVRLFRNVYVARVTQQSLDVRARGALLTAPDSAFVSHHTAAMLWGGSVPQSSGVHVTISRSDSLQVDGIRTHESVLRRHVVTMRNGVRLTTPTQTFIDLGSCLDLVQLVVLGDRLVRRQRTTPEQLRIAAQNWDGPHQNLVCRAAELVRPGVDSVPESRLRMLIVLSGLPEPTVNHILRDPETGDWLRRCELAYKELKLAIEYEGRHHRDGDDIWAADIERREDLDHDAWRIVQVISDGLFKTPLRTLQRIERARVDRGARPTMFRDEWKRYFPGQ